MSNKLFSQHGQSCYSNLVNNMDQWDKILVFVAQNQLSGTGMMALEVRHIIIPGTWGL